MCNRILGYKYAALFWETANSNIRQNAIGIAKSAERINQTTKNLTPNCPF